MRREERVETPTIRRFRVVANDEEQYSIWPVDRDLPLGWSESGRVGTKEECLAEIAEVWTDMRPKSLRDRMTAAADGAAAAGRPRADTASKSRTPRTTPARGRRR